MAGGVGRKSWGELKTAEATASNTACIGAERIKGHLLPDGIGQ